MTIVQAKPHRTSSAATWSVAAAKAQFSELIDRTHTSGPQTITRNGRVAAIVVAPDEWKRKTRGTGNLAEFLASSPLRESGLVLERSADRPRNVAL